MCSQVVVWNSDARYKPELEVELEIVTSEHDVPGFYYARSAAALEVEIEIVELDEVVALDEYTVYDEPPRGYAEAFRLAV